MSEAISTRPISIAAFASEATVAITVATGLPIVRIVAFEASPCSPPRMSRDGAEADGWAAMPFEADGGGTWPGEVAVDDGRLVLDLPRRVAVRDFEVGLHAALAGHELKLEGDRVSTGGRGNVFAVPASLLRLGDAMRTLVEHPLFTIDPTCNLPLVARRALEARRACVTQAKARRA